MRKKIKTFTVRSLQGLLDLDKVFDAKIKTWLDENPDVEILDMRTSASNKVFVLHVLYI